ncbi:DUF3243 domain-containing protein [Aneurinibacillus terranovensis]|uniref:DUF3243 domain-containing protein n=1 Tax=Aneurinibacillus terranovensis TaxID=278991 RepID=UPI000400EC0C|nr:DUF3243 domain-containing protein [Aneurinibacillus terranovensis]
MSVLENFGDWREFLSSRVSQGIASGMNEESMQNVAYEIGDYLADKVDPKNEQERLLKDLWESGNEQERRTMAGLMMKYVQNKR